MTQATTPRTDGNALQAGTVGLIGAATLGMVFLSPAMTLYGLFGPMFLACGKFTPLAFVLGLIATLPTAFSYAVLSRDYPSSGSTADWSTRALGRRAGGWAGWLVLLYYVTNFTIQVAAVGLFFNELLLATGVRLPHGSGFVIGVLAGSALPAWMVYRGLSISTKGALVFLLVEIATVAALCVTIVAVAPAGGVDAGGFDVAAAARQPGGMFQALVFAILGFCGFDVVSTLSEEAKAPRKLIPQATIVALLLYAVVEIAGAWALTFGVDADRLRATVDAGGTPINDIAAHVWGRGAILVTITALTATLGLIVATAVGASRVLFDAGRRGAAPAAFGRLHAAHRVPWPALHAIFAAGFVGTFVVFACLGSYGAYVWWCTAGTFFAVLTFLFCNVAAVVLNRGRLASPAGLLLYGLVPALGVVADAYILVKSFFIETWNSPGMAGKSAVVFDVACALIALAFVLARKPGRPTPPRDDATNPDFAAAGIGGVA